MVLPAACRSRSISDRGDTWTWTGIDADSKLIVSWFIGARDSFSAKLFIDDLASRLANRVQLTSDGLKALTNAFSKKLENHAHAAALFMVYYNFCKLHKAHRLTPAMAAGVTDRLGEIGDIVKVLEEWERSRSPHVARS